MLSILSTSTNEKRRKHDCDCDGEDNCLIEEEKKKIAPRIFIQVPHFEIGENSVGGCARLLRVCSQFCWKLATCRRVDRDQLVINSEDLCSSLYRSKKNRETRDDSCIGIISTNLLVKSHLAEKWTRVQARQIVWIISRWEMA